MTSYHAPIKIKYLFTYDDSKLVEIVLLTLHALDKIVFVFSSPHKNPQSSYPFVNRVKSPFE